jgi:hypothetical protein
LPSVQGWWRASADAGFPSSDRLGNHGCSWSISTLILGRG